MNFNWTVVDASNGQYVIYQNGTAVVSGDWSSNSLLTYNFIAVLSGSYNLTIVVTDISGNFDYDTVIIVVNEEVSVSTTPEGTTSEKQSTSPTSSETTVPKPTTSTNSTNEESPLVFWVNGLFFLVIIVRRKLKQN